MLSAERENNQLVRVLFGEVHAQVVDAAQATKRVKGSLWGLRARKLCK